MTSVFDRDETRFDDVDRATTARAFPDYLTRMAAELAAVKRGLHDLLGVGPGDRVLDVGCGTGADVRALAERVGPHGRAVGIDNSQLLIDEASAQSADGAPVELRVGDAHALPFEDGAFDACRAERVMMHLADPDRALAELVRVTRPGGRVLVADPDHGMWAVDTPHVDATRRLLAWWFDFIANPWVARRMPGRFAAAGLADVEVSLSPIVLRDLTAADAMTGIARAASAAAAEGVLSAEERDKFDGALRAAQREARFLMCGAMVVSLGRRPGPQ
jgi:ubiquinone/menaquinone biosynthesis C-methylase UbiE